jgi:Leucine-rich repeat (LRR) protein
MKTENKFDIESYLDSLPVHITELDVSEKKLKYLPDISRFTGLEKLFCYKNSITELPELPKNLKELTCYGNNLTKIEIDELHDLITLDCRYNKLTKLPNLNLHKRLLYLFCSENKLKKLPELPDSLQLLRCDHNKLHTLPSLPNNIEELYCDSNQLKKLPLLPRKLVRLVCCNNHLTELPPFPPKLTAVFCQYNELGSLPLLNDGVYVSFYGNTVLNLITNAEYNDEMGTPDYDVHNAHQYDKEELQQIVKTIYNFKYTYYCLKFKKRFRDFLWERVREPIAMKRYHPLELQKILDVTESSELDENVLLENW